MSWWDIIKYTPEQEANLEYQQRPRQQQTLETQSQPLSPQIPSTPEHTAQFESEQSQGEQQQNLSEVAGRFNLPNVPKVQSSAPNPLKDLSNLGDVYNRGKFEQQPVLPSQTQQPQQQQQTTTATDSGDAGSDVGETVGRIKQHLARNPQGAKGIKLLPVIEKLILASQNPTGMPQEVKDSVKQLKQIVPTAV